MNRLESLLKEEKIEYDSINAPLEIDERLRIALYKKTARKSKKPAGLVIAVLTLFLLMGFNYDAIAYYGKRILGYDMIMSGTLKNLNELGKGQEINKSYTFSNGISVILDGIMLDDNNLLAFYTIKSNEGNIESVNMLPVYIKGFGEYINRGGQGRTNNEESEIKWISRFDTPPFYERRMRLCISISKDGVVEEGEITFTLDRNKAMGFIIKEKVNKSIDIGDNDVHIEDITATPTSTVIRGSINDFAQYINEIRKYNSGPYMRVEMSLFADGKKINRLGSGIKTKPQGITYEQRFDALPNEAKNLDIYIDKMSIRKTIDETIEISTDMKDYEAVLQGESIIIKKITCDDCSTYITISSAEHVKLYNLKVLYDKREAPFDKVTGEKYDKVPSKGIIYERTLKFAGKGKNMRLEIGDMVYMANFNEHLKISVD